MRESEVEAMDDERAGGGVAEGTDRRGIHRGGRGQLAARTEEARAPA